MSNDDSRILQHCVRKYIKFNQFVWQNRTLNFFIETFFFLSLIITLCGEDMNMCQ